MIHRKNQSSERGEHYLCLVGGVTSNGSLSQIPVFNYITPTNLLKSNHPISPYSNLTDTCRSQPATVRAYIAINIRRFGPRR